MFAIHQARRVLEARRQVGRWYTIFVDSTAAIDRMRPDEPGPGQAFAVATIGLADEIHSRGSSVVIRWTPAHQGVEGNEAADGHAEEAAQGRGCERVEDRVLKMASLAHLRREATERRSQTTREWIGAHVRSTRQYRPPSDTGLRRRSLQRTKRLCWKGTISSCRATRRSAPSSIG